MTKDTGMRTDYNCDICDFFYRVEDLTDAQIQELIGTYSEYAFTKPFIKLLTGYCSYYRKPVLNKTVGCIR